MSELVWKRPGRCDTGSCVAVAHVGDKVWVRDSKLGDDSPVIEYTRGQWGLVLGAIRVSGRTVGVRRRLLPWLGWVWRWKGKTLRFTRAEWKAFVDGVNDGEFDGEFDHAG